MNDFKLDTKSKIETGFKTPDLYFESFSERILKQIPEDQSKVISIFKSSKTLFFAVAAVLVLLFTIPMINQKENSSKLDQTILEDYLTNQAEINDDDLVLLLDEIDIQKIIIDTKIEDKIIEDLLISNSQLETYIIN